MTDKNKENSTASDVIEGHKACQARDAKWLCLNDIYYYLQRPNFYDIGGTYIDTITDFWFLYKTEHVSNLYLLHLFILNAQEGSFTISVSDNIEQKINNHTNIIKLDSIFKHFEFSELPRATYSYLLTYSFNELDFEMMQNKKLLIAVKFNTVSLKQQSILHYSKCLHDFGQVFLDPVDGDFTIESGDGAKFPVHKFMLAAHGREVFKAMLKDNTAESINNTVKIDDVEKEDLSCIIEFIYTGSVKDIENRNCFNLLMLGERYDIKGLKELAQHVLAQQINNDNALETLLAADMYNSANLKVSSFKYIKKNAESLEDPIFHKIKNTQLVQELCKYLASN